MEKQIAEIMEQLKYYNIKCIKNGIWIKFQMRNKQNKVIVTLRCYVENNFNPKSKWYETIDTTVRKLKSDYQYITSYRLDCQ